MRLSRLSFPNKRAILNSEMQSLIISFLSDNCVEIHTLMCELLFYFCLILYNCHLTHLTNSRPSALTSPPPPIYFQPWCPPQSSVCLTKLSVAVCQSHINSQPWRGGNRAGRKMGTMVTVQWTSGRHSYTVMHYNTCSV